MGKEPEQTLLQGRYTEGPETYEKMLSFTSPQGDANLNHNEIPLYTGQNDHHKQSNEQVFERLWRKGNPIILLVIMQTGAATVENSKEFRQKTKIGIAF